MKRLIEILKEIAFFVFVILTALVLSPLWLPHVLAGFVSECIRAMKARNEHSKVREAEDGAGKGTSLSIVPEDGD